MGVGTKRSVRAWHRRGGQRHGSIELAGEHGRRGEARRSARGEDPYLSRARQEVVVNGVTWLNKAAPSRGHPEAGTGMRRGGGRGRGSGGGGGNGGEGGRGGGGGGGAD